MSLYESPPPPDSPSLTFLSRMLGINFTPMDDFIERYVNDPRADGNLDAMFQVSLLL